MHVHLFQMLEKDPEVRRRFEEASAMELRQGWEAAAEADKAKKMKKHKGKMLPQDDVDEEEKQDGESSVGQMEMRDLSALSPSRSQSQPDLTQSYVGTTSMQSYVGTTQSIMVETQSTEELERQITARFGVQRNGSLR